VRLALCRPQQEPFRHPTVMAVIALYVVFIVVLLGMCTAGLKNR
jgi:hypothetical protein